MTVAPATRCCGAGCLQLTLLQLAAEMFETNKLPAAVVLLPLLLLLMLTAAFISCAPPEEWTGSRPRC
jgi:hypothetical protein